MGKKEEAVVADFGRFACRAYGEEKGSAVMEDAEKRYAEMCRAHAADPKAVRMHTEGTIFPAIAFYEAIRAKGIPKDEAVQFIYDTCAERAEVPAEQMRRMMRIPGAYYLMPFAWKLVTRQTFGHAAGFQYHFYKTGARRVKFDMTKCLFCEVCKAYGCPEIVPAFCHTDDVQNGNLHPKLHWNRTKTMGDGADCCDFDLYIQ